MLDAVTLVAPDIYSAANLKYRELIPKYYILYSEIHLRTGSPFSFARWRYSKPHTNQWDGYDHGVMIS